MKMGEGLVARFEHGNSWCSVRESYFPSGENHGLGHYNGSDDAPRSPFCLNFGERDLELGYD